MNTTASSCVCVWLFLRFTAAQALQAGNALVGIKTYDIRMNPAYEEAFYTVE